MMTVGELRELLEGVDDDVEVRLAVQPSWPFEHRVTSDVTVRDDVVYLADAGQIGYLPEGVAEEAWA